MNQKELLDVAKQQQGLTSDYQLAQRLGVSTGRLSSLRKGTQTADEAEILMLADMAGIEPHKAFAAVHKDREKNPAKRAYWEKISMELAIAGLAAIVIWSGFPSDANAAPVNSPIYKLCEIIVIFMVSNFAFQRAIINRYHF